MPSATYDGWRKMGPIEISGRQMPVILLLVAAFFAWNFEVLAQTFPSPRQLKRDAITALEQIATTDQRLKRTIDGAVKDIGRSLLDFRDESRVSDKKVFEREREAAEALLKAVKRRHTPQDIKLVFQGIIDSLVEADRSVAEVSISTARQLVQFGEGNSKKLAKAQCGRVS